MMFLCFCVLFLYLSQSHTIQNLILVLENANYVLSLRHVLKRGIIEIDSKIMRIMSQIVLLLEKILFAMRLTKANREL